MGLFAFGEYFFGTEDEKKGCVGNTSPLRQCVSMGAKGSRLESVFCNSLELCT